MRAVNGAFFLVFLSAIAGCSSGKSAQGTGNGSTFSLDPASSSTPYYLSLAGDASAVPLFPTYGRFYVNSDPSQNAAPSGEPWYEFQIATSPCTLPSPTSCSLSTQRIYIIINCPGYVGNAAGCVSAVRNMNIASAPSGVTVGVSLQNVIYKNNGYSGTAVQGTISVSRSPDTPPPQYAAGLVDDASKFEVSLKNVTFKQTYNGPIPNFLASLANFRGEFWGDKLL